MELGLFFLQSSNAVSNIYVGDDGNIHVVKDGADSVLPFSKGETGCVLLGSYSGGSKTFDCTSIEGYGSLTVNNFFFRMSSVSVGNRTNVLNGATEKFSYNASTGIVTFSLKGDTLYYATSDTGTWYAKGNVYCYY